MKPVKLLQNYKDFIFTHAYRIAHHQTFNMGESEVSIQTAINHVMLNYKNDLTPLTRHVDELIGLSDAKIVQQAQTNLTDTGVSNYSKSALLLEAIALESQSRIESHLNLSRIYQ